MTNETTREGWMHAFTNAARSVFRERANIEIPGNVRMSVGFASKGRRSKTIGECYAPDASSDGSREIFIVPHRLDSDAEIAAVLTHELIHASFPFGEGHGRSFGKAARALGLVGKLTATTGGADWEAWAKPILDAIGPLPYAKMQLDGARAAGGAKAQTNRHLKHVCTECGLTVRLTAAHTRPEMRCIDLHCDGDLVAA